MNRTLVTIVAVFGLAGLLCLAQSRPPVVTGKTSLTIPGYSGRAPLVQMNGKSYVDIESLARLTNGTISFQGTDIVLTLAGGASASVAPAEAPAKTALSKEFLRASIEELSVIREWRVAILNSIQNNNAVTEDWAAVYGRNADDKLALASVAAVKDPDRDFLALLKNDLSFMKKLSDHYRSLRQQQTFIAHDALDNDTLDQQITNCTRGLGDLVASGQFQDAAVCH